jgi:hypothetical protein
MTESRSEAVYSRLGVSLWGDGPALHPDQVVSTWVCMFLKDYSTKYLEWAHFIVCLKLIF